jgi:hypothetical protein
MNGHANATAKGLGTRQENNRIKGTRQSVANLLHQAINRRLVELEKLRKLVSQIDSASPFLVERFWEEADEPWDSDLGLKFVSDYFGYLDEKRMEPWRGRDVACLDAYLHHHITSKQLRHTKLTSR